jgi:serine/threonine protein kinase
VKIIECWEPLPGANPRPLDARAQAAVQGSQAAVVEALLARSLSHPHIVTTFCHGMSSEEVRDLGRRHSQVWIVQEYCNRGALLDAINSGALHHPEGGGPNLATILLTAQEVAGACAYLHGHDVIHGDLTPSNVLLTSATKDLRRWTCKVCDFGLAKHAGGAKELQSTSFGTVTYMPPELLSEGKLSKAAGGLRKPAGWCGSNMQRGGVHGDMAFAALPEERALAPHTRPARMPRHPPCLSASLDAPLCCRPLPLNSWAADVYSFGIILLEMFYGRRAWLGMPPLRILAKVSAGMLPFEVPADAPQPLASLMRRCLDLDPSRRPPFTAILVEVQALLRTLSRPTSPQPRGGEASRPPAALSPFASPPPEPASP